VDDFSDFERLITLLAALGLMCLSIILSVLVGLREYLSDMDPPLALSFVALGFGCAAFAFAVLVVLSSCS